MAGKQEDVAMEEEGDAVEQEAGSSSTNQPNHTLYVNNLNERVKEAELKESLYAVFSPYGEVIDICLQKTLRLRGQAWIVFKDIASATAAVREMNSFVFYDKPMGVQFARTQSDAINELKGVKVDKFERKLAKRKRQQEVDEQRAKRKKMAAAGKAKASAPRNLPKQRNEPPNKILFVENLPEEANKEALSALFSQFAGFLEVRTIPGKKGIAFVEYTNEMEAGVALTALHHFKLTETDLMVVSFAKK